MAKLTLMTDSASDITVENQQEYGIRVVCFQHAFGDKNYTSRVDFDNEKYYAMLDAFDGIPATSQITPFQFGEIFAQEFQSGCQGLIYVSINSKGSATYENAVAARAAFYDDFPQAREQMPIFLIDGRNYTGGYGYAVVEGAKRLRAGAGLEEVADFITDWCAHCEILFVPYTLKYAAKSGRINGAAALLGNALGIKPLMLIRDQAINDVAKLRGEKRVIPAIAQRTLQEWKAGTPYLIVYGSDPQLGEEMARVMEEQVGYPPADKYQIGAEIAANAGPKVVGVIYYSKG